MESKGFNAKEYAFSLDESLQLTGTQINYYFVCKRKLWLSSHNMELESESDLVRMGRLLHEESYKRKLKEVQVDRIKVDFLERKASEASTSSNVERTYEARTEGKGERSSIVIHEVKRSRAMHDAHVFQLLYYMYYLKKHYGTNVSRGILHYPLLKKNVPVELTAEKGRQVEEVIGGIQMTLSMPRPPAPISTRACRLCAYGELCWG